MSFIYLSHGFAIYPHRQLIEKGAETIQVRPKTFALLLLLLEQPREVLSKAFLLNSIWDDVTVEEQVLVQSVRELRQLFGNNEIIQTYPRKGYAWAEDVEKQSLSAPQAFEIASPHLIPPKTPSLPRLSRWRKAYSVLIIAAVLLLSASAIFFVHADSSASEQAEVVIVLPIKNRLPGNDFNWVPLGAMDQLIHLLVSNKNVQVMDSEYVLGVMTHAHLPRDYETADVARIFDVSGASLIVEAQLTGSVENYRLDYKLHFKNTIQRGAVFDRNLNIAIHKLGEVVVSHTGQSLNKSEANAQNAFSNELLARALEQKDAGEFALASNLFSSLKQLEPNNMIARIHLAQSLVRLKDFDRALVEIDSAIELAKATHSPELTQLYFGLAWVKREQGFNDQALSILLLADSAADSVDNMLARAAIAGLRGEIEQSHNAVDLAQSSFEQSLKFNTVIGCPIGISDMHLKLAGLLSSQGKPLLAQEHYREAKNIIETHQLDDMRPALDRFKLL